MMMPFRRVAVTLVREPTPEVCVHTERAQDT